MKKPFLLNSTNIEEVFRNTKKKLSKTPDYEFIIPKSALFVLSERYSGKGRPKNSDYDYNPIFKSSLGLIK